MARTLPNKGRAASADFDLSKGGIMKKVISTFLMVAMMAIMMPLMASQASAATAAAGSGIRPCYGGRVYRERRGNVYQRNKTLFNTIIAAGIGTAIGAVVDGKRGALIGAGAGGGGYLLYKYIRDKRGNCRKVYLRR